MTENAKILVVDDEPEFLDVMGMRLSAQGYEVVTAGNGKEAVQQVHDQGPDLILLDLMMPGMDGGDIAQVLRTDPKAQGTPVIYLTALLGPEEAKRRNEKRPDEVFASKTGDVGDLLKLIEGALREGEGQDAAN